MEDDYIILHASGLADSHRFMAMVDMLTKGNKSYSTKKVEERSTDAILRAVGWPKDLPRLIRCNSLNGRYELISHEEVYELITFGFKATGDLF